MNLQGAVQAIKIDANVNPDHTVTINLPDDVPIGPAEVILLYNEAAQSSPLDGNGPNILKAISESRHPSVEFWKGVSQEIGRARDDWDAS